MQMTPCYLDMFRIPALNDGVFTTQCCLAGLCGRFWCRRAHRSPQIFKKSPPGFLVALTLSVLSW